MPWWAWARFRRTRVVWPEIADLAGASITATSTVAGAALGVVGAVVIWPRH